jgi:hypothetical protein
LLDLVVFDGDLFHDRDEGRGQEGSAVLRFASAEETIGVWLSCAVETGGVVW